MECGLIFYTAHKTSYCESALELVLKGRNTKISSVFAAMAPSELGEFINKTLNEYDLVFIISNIKRTDVKSVLNVLSAGLSSFSPKPKVKTACLENGQTAQQVLMGKKKLIVLPDLPESIPELMKKL